MPQVARLFQFFKPNHYTLHLSPDASALTFEGVVSIQGAYSGTDRLLRLHAKELSITAVTVNDMPHEFHLDIENDELCIELEDSEASDLSVGITFNGRITKPMHGIYPCTASNGQVIIATQFESHHAREAFPCIDEPEAKATFELSLTTPKELVALSNMPSASRTEAGTQATTVFETTPIMSTYLLAFVYGDLHCVEQKTKNGTEVRIWASKDHKTESLMFALDTSVRSIEFFNDYFQTPYPLAKCDHVALPDFSSGAMENWGLITYREVCLIVDPEKTSANTKEMVATVITHELSHQWFGNLVTMQWWDDLWLNESFATLMEYICVDALFPEWDIMLSFASQEALSALWRDSIHGVQSVYCEVTHPDQISTLFDPSIVYAKGARLLLMARNLVGEKAFRTGLQNYFIDFAYKNTAGDDLWNALSKASNIDVAGFMNVWLKQPGFPLLSVEQDGTQLTLEQSRFRLSSVKSDGSLWPIPLSPKPSILDLAVLDQQKTSLQLKSSDFIRFNSGGAHISVRYEQHWQRQALAQLIESEDASITPSERLLVLNDSLMQSRAGASSIIETLELLAAFHNERQETVWNVMSLCIADSRRLVETNEAAEVIMKSYVFGLVSNLYSELGWQKQKSEALNDTKLRSTILSLACYSEKPEVIAEALAQYASFENIAAMPADTRHILLAMAVKHGKKNDFESLFAAYPKEINAELQQDICGALSTTKDPENIAKILRNLTNPDFVRLQDVDRWIVYLLRNRWSRQAAWDWLTSNWHWIEENFASDKSYDNYPRYAASVFSTNEWQKAYVDFFTPQMKVTALKRNIELGIEEIAGRVDWRERDEALLVTWLEQLPQSALIQRSAV